MIWVLAFLVVGLIGWIAWLEHTKPAVPINITVHLKTDCKGNIIEQSEQITQGDRKTKKQPIEIERDRNWFLDVKPTDKNI